MSSAEDAIMLSLIEVFEKQCSKILAGCDNAYIFKPLLLILVVQPCYYIPGSLQVLNRSFVRKCTPLCDSLTCSFSHATRSAPHTAMCWTYSQLSLCSWPLQEAFRVFHISALNSRCLSCFYTVLYSGARNRCAGSAGWAGLYPVPALLFVGPVAAESRGKRITVEWFQAQQHKATTSDKLQTLSIAKTEG